MNWAQRFHLFALVVYILAFINYSVAVAKYLMAHP